MSIACHCGVANENFCSVFYKDKLNLISLVLDQFSSTRHVGQTTSPSNAVRRTIIFVTSPDLLGLESSYSNVPAILFSFKDFIS